jgi:hypothetical protein
MLDGPCLGAGAAMALNHWNPDAAVAFHRQLGTNVGVFYPLSPLSRPSPHAVCSWGVLVSKCATALVSKCRALVSKCRAKCARSASVCAHS